MLDQRPISGCFNVRIASRFSAKISKLLKRSQHTPMELVRAPSTQARPKRTNTFHSTNDSTLFSPEKTRNTSHPMRVHDHTKKLRAIYAPIAKPQIRIHINRVERVENGAKVLKAKTLLDLEDSTNDSSFANQGSVSSNNTPSPCTAITPKKECNRSKVQEHPARYLSVNEVQHMTRRKDRGNLTIPPQKTDLSMGLIEKDKVEFENELLFRKYRKHKVMKNLMETEEDQWDWASYGSSPTNKVRFVE